MSSSYRQLALSLGVQCANGQYLEHLSRVVCPDVPVKHVLESLPQSLAFQFSLFKSLGSLLIGDSSSACCLLRDLQLSQYSFVFGVEHSNVPLEII